MTWTINIIMVSISLSHHVLTIVSPVYFSISQFSLDRVEQNQLLPCKCMRTGCNSEDYLVDQLFN